MTLYLISFRPDFTRLMALAAREKLLPPGGDLGYALHAVMAASFGDLEPKPFRAFRPGEPGGGPSGRLLAYSSAPLEALRAHATTFADPAFSAPLQLDSAEERPMPSGFAAGSRLGFNLRLRPVQRTGASSDGRERARERDVYSGSATDDEPGRLGRVRAYTAWLDRQLGHDRAAHLLTAEVDRLCRTGLFARNRSGQGNRNRMVDGPDITLSGVLSVVDSAAFDALLARGVGRFRAFGFGMLLLRPPD
ncbi:type I-E CRISPR-associated protein Cas6/Cse3/CasE [Pleomorphomonas sp. NRK KF1]|uniref:type I-E CRISPR-associated protein Cas6/Cse3/CasE n=1 Tax=Pleomorphomonas sp. NRK KF1 TaxID=2943000 RepID=UPI0020433C0F|nr:type I-E CRISPR-associated protein Cas6/Cse3/CasE [Pleomorphomonas sp. NRK KF1]MCM5552384.1 type I-E CRISPR-associated protein Cas6/Cse3/CasE [Pleomorphomonas sp. NRK KF1]